MIPQKPRPTHFDSRYSLDTFPAALWKISTDCSLGRDRSCLRQCSATTRGPYALTPFVTAIVRALPSSAASRIKWARSLPPTLDDRSVLVNCWRIETSERAEKITAETIGPDSISVNCHK
jgi:hypothetical protein